MAFLFSLPIWRLVQPHLTLEPESSTTSLGILALTDSLPALANTTLCSFLFMPEGIKDTVVYIPLPKWRKEKHSC